MRAGENSICNVEDVISLRTRCFSENVIYMVFSRRSSFDVNSLIHQDHSNAYRLCVATFERLRPLLGLKATRAFILPGWGPCSCKAALMKIASSAMKAVRWSSSSHTHDHRSPRPVVVSWRLTRVALFKSRVNVRANITLIAFHLKGTMSEFVALSVPLSEHCRLGVATQIPSMTTLLAPEVIRKSVRFCRSRTEANQRQDFLNFRI